MGAVVSRRSAPPGDCEKSPSGVSGAKRATVQLDGDTDPSTRSQRALALRSRSADSQASPSGSSVLKNPTSRDAGKVVSNAGGTPPNTPGKASGSPSAVSPPTAPGTRNHALLARGNGETLEETERTKERDPVKVTKKPSSTVDQSSPDDAESVPAAHDAAVSTVGDRDAERPTTNEGSAGSGTPHILPEPRQDADAKRGDDDKPSSAQPSSTDIEMRVDKGDANDESHQNAIPATVTLAPKIVESPLPRAANDSSVTNESPDNTQLTSSTKEQSEPNPPAYDSSNVVAAAATEPERVLCRNEDVHSAFRAVLRDLYVRQSDMERASQKFSRPRKRGQRHLRGGLTISIGPLQDITVHRKVETEQVWEQLALRNRAGFGDLEEQVKQATRLAAEAVAGGRDDSGLQSKAGAKSSSREEAKRGATPGKHTQNGLVEDSSESEESDAAARLSGSEASGDEQEKEPLDTKKDGAAQFDSAMPASTEASLVGKPAKKVRFQLDDNEENEGESSDASDANSVDEDVSEQIQPPSQLEDGFFNIADMEAFADEAEHLAEQGRLADSDGSENSDEEDGSDASGKLTHNGVAVPPPEQGALDGSDSRRMRYQDFFDPPAEAGPDSTAASALRRAALLEDAEADGYDELQQTPATPLEQQRQSLREKMSAIEDANVGKKPWQLRGEIDSQSRPFNSLLESDFEHDVAARVQGSGDADVTVPVEDLIRQRIVDGLFDDVVRKLPPDYESAKESRKKQQGPELSQEKAKEGLAELYEAEFVEERNRIAKSAEAASGSVTKEADEQLSPEQQEVSKLFSRLSTKLDALSSLHFTPSAPKLPDEMEVKPNVAALHAEEAIPEAVSDAALLAPREVHDPKTPTEPGSSEINKAGRRRRRRKKKREISASNKEKESEEKRKAKSDPALAAQKRAERVLHRPGKMLQPAIAKPRKRAKQNGTLGVVRSGSVAYSKSTRFFGELQSTISRDLEAKKPRSSGVLASAATPTPSTRLKL